MTVRLLALPPLPLDKLTALFGVEGIDVEIPTERTQAAVEDALPSVDVVLGDWSPQLRLDEPGPTVRFVQQPSVGVDGIDLVTCARRGVPVANAAGANTTSVAEWCLTTTLMLLKRAVAADTAVREGEWPQTTLGAQELSGRRVGVVGMGPIGRATAALFTTVGCDVRYWSRSPKPDVAIPYLELDDLLSSSDVVVIVIALGADTYGLIDPRRLRTGAVLINASRGDVVHEAHLVEALDQSILAGAALDVFSIEPLPADSPLRRPDVLLSPHAAGSTTQAAQRIVAQVRANLTRLLAGEPLQDVVNGLPPFPRPIAPCK